MATKHKQASLVSVEEDYIDMELGSHSIGSPQQNREFEFQKERESTTSPADELFYEGKILPLHQPSRQLMLQKHLGNTNATFDRVRSLSCLDDRSYPHHIDLRLASKNTTPLESSIISPSEPNPSELPITWSTEIAGLVDDFPKKSSPTKLKQTKQFWLLQRLKASSSYLKSLFTKSGSSDKSSAVNPKKVEEVTKATCKENQKKNVKDAAGKNSIETVDGNKSWRFGAVMKSKSKRDVVEDSFIIRSRRSFSGVVHRHCATKASSFSIPSSGSSSTSSSFSCSSARFHDLQMLKRSISANYDLESSIEGAIDHCKQSQLKFSSNKGPVNDDRVCSQFGSKLAVSGNQEITQVG